MITGPCKVLLKRNPYIRCDICGVPAHVNVMYRQRMGWDEQDELYCHDCLSDDDTETIGEIAYTPCGWCGKATEDSKLVAYADPLDGCMDRLCGDCFIVNDIDAPGAPGMTARLRYAFTVYGEMHSPLSDDDIPF